MRSTPAIIKTSLNILTTHGHPHTYIHTNEAKKIKYLVKAFKTYKIKYYSRNWTKYTCHLNKKNIGVNHQL